MFTQIHINTTCEQKRNVVFNYLYNWNIRTLIKEGKVITDVWKEICRQTASDDVRDLVLSRNLDSYYNRLVRGAI